MSNRVLKKSLSLTAVIVACSLTGLIIGIIIPAERTEIITTANYNQQGEFNYTGYREIKSSQPNHILFNKIIDDITIYFADSGFGNDTPSITVVLEDRNGNWQKEVPVEVTGSPVVSFPLDLDGILELGDTINDEIGARNRDYLLKITAVVETEDDPFIAVLEGELDSSSLQWKEETFSKSTRGYPGGDEWRQGAFGYSVNLRQNELFTIETLERKPELPLTAAVTLPDIALFTVIIKSLDIGFNYQFNSDAHIDSLDMEAEIWMVMEDPGHWKKSFTLLFPTKIEDEDELNFNVPVDIGEIIEIAADIDSQLNIMGARERLITIFAKVHTVAHTNAGTIEEVFNQQLNGRIGAAIDFESDLALTEEGKLTEINIESNPMPNILQKVSIITLGIGFLAFCASAFFYWKRRPVPSFLEEELKKNKKRYKELISEVDEYPAIKEEETVVNVSSIESLVNISNNSLKPLLLKTEPEKHIYWVTDGSSRYCFIRVNEETMNIDEITVAQGFWQETKD